MNSRPTLLIETIVKAQGSGLNKGNQMWKSPRSNHPHTTLTKAPIVQSASYVGSLNLFDYDFWCMKSYRYTACMDVYIECVPLCYKLPQNVLLIYSPVPHVRKTTKSNFLFPMLEAIVFYCTSHKLISPLTPHLNHN